VLVGVFVFVGVEVLVGVDVAVGVLPGSSVPVTVAVLERAGFCVDNLVGVNNTNVPVDVGVDVVSAVAGTRVGVAFSVAVTVAFGILVGAEYPGVRKSLIQTGAVRMAGSSGGRA
jgi:type III secretory pathway component EscT